MKKQSRFKIKSNKKNNPKLLIIKSSGNTEYFSAKKLERSIRRTGLPPKNIKEITKEVCQNIKPGTSTHDIFSNAIKLIRKKSLKAAAHYSLKKSLVDLGPTGFEFEYFVSKYFEELGYQTIVGSLIKGKFVQHEIDVIAKKLNHHIFIECKFHNNMGRTNDIKIVLYIKSRWDDLKNGPNGKHLEEFYVVSNTAFSTDAITYSNGIGLKLLGVNVPEEDSFLDKIKRFNLYPITSLKKLKQSYCRELLHKKIILCKDLLFEKTLLLKIGMTEEEIKSLFQDINLLLDQNRS